MKKLSFCFILFNLMVLAQNSSRLTLNLSAGAGFGSESVYSFLDVLNRKVETLSYNPDLSGKIGLFYRSAVNIIGLDVSPGIEMGVFKSSTEKTLGRFEQTLLPLTFSIILENDKELSPYLKLGIGAGEKKYTQEFEFNSDANITARKWLLVFQWGMGLYYKINEVWEVSLFAESVVLDGTISGENMYGYTIEIVGMQATAYVGMQVGYSIGIW